jgi:hydroxypyruvate reductase
VTRLLLRRGAAIDEINAVRKRLSRLKGGGFARLAAPARVVTLALSDVPGDDKGVIGSGPTVDDPGAANRARRAIHKFCRGRDLPLGIQRALKRPQARAPLRRARIFVIGSARTFARAARREAQRLGFQAQVLEGGLRGEARRCGPALVATFARKRRLRPFCLIATGETVVSVIGRGQGGRNQEVALSAVPALARLPRPTVLAAFATDGRDGTSPASGGLVDDRTAQRAKDLGASVEAALRRNDSSRALERLDALMVTGATGTNVADVTVVLG